MTNEFTLLDVEYSFPCVKAGSWPHPLARLRNNPLISALRPWPSEKALRKLLEFLPDYDESHRQLDRPMRVQQLQQLKRFAIPLPRVLQLAETMHATMLEGYVGREPHTPEANRRLAEVYNSPDIESYARLRDSANAAQFTSALLGMSGVGKSTSLETIAGLYPPVIHHPEHNMYQIPTLLIEMAYDGASIATLATAILTALDKKFPAGNYRKLYIEARGNAEQKLLFAFALLQVHAVGLIIVDEAQNKKYTKTQADETDFMGGQSPLSTLLITASNQMQVPLLLTGTAELKKVLGKRMSQLRRMVGSGMRPWTALSTSAVGNRRSEFDVFLTILWRFQWTKHACPLTPALQNLFYQLTGGVPDFVVKLYAAVQNRAMYGDEMITPELIREVGDAEFGAVADIVRAIVKRDKKSLAKIVHISDISAELGISPTDDLLTGSEIHLSRNNEQAAILSAVVHQSPPQSPPLCGDGQGHPHAQPQTKRIEASTTGVAATSMAASGAVEEAARPAPGARAPATQPATMSELFRR
ncbi:ATP-binding protein [Pseudorhodoferax soli]|uniref:AAA domain-containing protein n=1 Tax=Pseudorhodoferax soli TaxID=545864 RepID=A0A368XNS5_9BURK|nr:ATP-binding protein [Pseudorhodoferax soli]RCW69209.1 AAA domain-containing protein [Pseudorhodoferax soli]